MHIITDKGTRNISFYERNSFRILSTTYLNGAQVVFLGSDLGSREWLFLFYTNRFDLLLSFALGFQRHRPNLDPGCFGRTRLDDFAFLRRLLLDDVVLSARRRHQQP